MVENILIEDFKGIERCELKGLKKINIICGKNNTGKTALLEAINNGNNVSAGSPIDKDKIDGICRNLIPQDEPLLGEILVSTVRKVFSAKEIWYRQETQYFMKTLWKEYENSEGRIPTNPQYHELITSQIQALLLGILPLPSLVLIPAKRELINKTEVAEKVVKEVVYSNQLLSPDKGGVLKYLHELNHGGREKKRIYIEIQNAFKKISGCEFDLKIENNGKEIHLNFSSTVNTFSEITAENAGLGLQDLLIMVVYSLHPDYQIVLIEEPENHINPEMQRKLLAHLSEVENKQFIITTHSNVFLDLTYVNKIYRTMYDGKVRVSDASSKAEALDELGYSVIDNLVADLIILTEGITDISILEEFLSKMGLYGSYTVKFWPLCGDVMSQVDMSVFAENRNIMAIIDNDPESNKAREEFIAKCEDLNIPHTRLKRYAVENYFTPRVVNLVHNGSPNIPISHINPNIKLNDQLGFNAKKKNREMARAMTLGEIKSSEDLYDFLKEVKVFLEGITSHK